MRSLQACFAISHVRTERSRLEHRDGDAIGNRLSQCFLGPIVHFRVCHSCHLFPWPLGETQDLYDSGSRFSHIAQTGLTRANLRSQLPSSRGTPSETTVVPTGWRRPPRHLCSIVLRLSRYGASPPGHAGPRSPGHPRSTGRDWLGQSRRFHVGPSRAILGAVLPVTVGSPSCAGAPDVRTYTGQGQDRGVTPGPRPVAADRERFPQCAFRIRMSTIYSNARNPT